MHRTPDTESSRSWARASRLLLLCLCVLLSVVRGYGHTANESYLTFRIDGTNVTGQLDIARRDLVQGLTVGGMDAGALSAEERMRREEAFGLDLVSRLPLSLDGRLVSVDVTDFTTLPLNNGDYARLLFAASGVERPPVELRVDCRVLFSIDRSMHGLIRVEHNGRTDAVAYTAETAEHRFNLESGGNGDGWAQWLTFVKEGVWHIWIGFDHILFLIALLLPAVFRQGPAGWSSVDRFRPAFMNVLKVVTAFTMAHSITLSLAALSIVSLSSRLVESAIAASVVVAATNNLYPWFRDKGWMVAFAFGLIHGFGFASVLGDLGLVRSSLASALVGFNVGVELGQLAIVSLFLPAAFALRNGWAYRVLVLKAGSVVVILIAAVWMVERLFDLSILTGRG